MFCEFRKHPCYVVKIAEAQLSASPLSLQSDQCIHAWSNALGFGEVHQQSQFSQDTFST